MFLSESIEKKDLKKHTDSVKTMSATVEEQLRCMRFQELNVKINVGRVLRSSPGARCAWVTRPCDWGAQGPGIVTDQVVSGNGLWPRRAGHCHSVALPERSECLGYRPT